MIAVQAALIFSSAFPTHSAQWGECVANAEFASVRASSATWHKTMHGCRHAAAMTRPIRIVPSLRQHMKSTHLGADGALTFKCKPTNMTYRPQSASRLDCGRRYCDVCLRGKKRLAIDRNGVRPVDVRSERTRALHRPDGERNTRSCAYRAQSGAGGLHPQYPCLTPRGAPHSRLEKTAPGLRSITRVSAHDRLHPGYALAVWRRPKPQHSDAGMGQAPPE